MSRGEFSEKVRGVFVTGTDTDAGKTIITAGLLRGLVARGINALAVKPIQTGCATSEPDRPACKGTASPVSCAPISPISPISSVSPVPPDEALYRSALIGLDHIPDQHTTTWLRYQRACSPHFAAAEEGRPIDLDALAARFAALANTPPDDTHTPLHDRVVLLEGAGGVLVPLGPTITTRDLMVRLDLPVLLVAPNRLGVIHQVLSSLESLTAAGLNVLGVVLTRTRQHTADEEPVLLADHAPTITRLSGVPVLADVPWIDGLATEQPEAWDRLAAHLDPVLARLLPPKENRTAHTSSWCGSEHSFEEDEPPVLDFDRHHLWHPYASTEQPLPCREAVSAHGTRIRLADGRELVDGMSSWWCAVHGYGHPQLLAALHRQAAIMPHIMFGGLTHAPAVRLGRRLLSMLPAGLEHLFYADSGSVAVEVALKMALQYRQARGEPLRTLFVTPRGGYHGDTFGAMSVCDPVNGMHTQFSGMLTQQLFVERPSCRFDAPWNPAATLELEATLAAHSSRCTAVILEPIVQGAGGMWMYHPEYLRRVRTLCDDYGLLLICDEIATGFGRTGQLFAVDWAGVHPDIMCVGKALTGGMMTLAATAATAEVAHTIAADGGVLMHGPTFMANPLACAVATASLDLLSTSAWREQIALLGERLAAGLAPCREHPAVADVRLLGGIGVVELHRPVDVAALQDFFVDACRVWIRPFGRLIYLMPPYVSSAQDIARLTSAICRAVYEQRTRADDD